MQFSLLILAGPDSPGNLSAYRFAVSAIESGHRIYRVFFYHQGVQTGNQLITPAQDESNIPLNWQALAASHQLDMVICIASALRRGVVDAGEAQRHGKACANLASGFELAGLGQWVEAIRESDRIITFGP